MTIIRNFKNQSQRWILETNRSVYDYIYECQKPITSFYDYILEF